MLKTQSFLSTLVFLHTVGNKAFLQTTRWRDLDVQYQHPQSESKNTNYAL